jgi:hypothetical protein
VVNPFATPVKKPDRADSELHANTAGLAILIIFTE